MYTPAFMAIFNVVLLLTVGILVWKGRKSPKHTLMAVLLLAGVVIALPDRETTSSNETNRFVRYASVESWVRYEEWSIGDVLARVERGRQLDLSFKEGLPYSQKPPGISWGAIPVYWVMTKVYPGGRPPTHWTIAVLSLLTIFLPILIMSYFFGKKLMREYGARTGMLGVAILLVSSPMCIYAMMFMGYTRPTMLLVTGYLLLRGGDSRARYFSAALLMGCAGVDNMVFWGYGALVAGIELGRRISEGQEWRRYLVWGLLGVAIPGIALLTYNWTVWGGPFTTAYAPGFLNKEHILRHQSIGWQWEMLYQALFGAKLGIFFHAPWAWVGVFGIASMISKRVHRWEGITALSMFLAPIVFTTIWVGSNPDDSPFNRHVLPAFPWLCWGVAHLVTQAQMWSFFRRKAFVGLLGTMIAIATFLQWLTVWIAPFNPNELHSPIVQFSMPLFVSGSRMPVLDLDPTRVPGMENLSMGYWWTWIHLGYILLISVIILCRPYRQKEGIER